MLIYGILSLLQVIFLPGFIFLNLINYHQKPMRATLLSFGLSLSINYLFVLILLALHCYSHTAIRNLFVVEMVVLLWLQRAFLFKKISSTVKFQGFSLAKEFNLVDLLPKLIAILFTGYLTFYYIFLDPNPKSIFNNWDAVVSWNRWAQNWFQNSPPLDTRDYPQLLPFNISMTYQFMNTTVIQLFGRAIFYVFPVSMIGCLWNLGKAQKEDGYFWAIPFLIILLLTLFGTLSVSGYADIPVAGMALLSLYPLMLPLEQNSQAQIIKKILIGTVICAGTAVTKQAGIYLAFVYPVLIYLLVLKKSVLFNKKMTYQMFVCVCLLLLFYIAPWYLYKLMKFHSGLDSSVTPYLLSGAAYSVPAASLSARAAFAISSLFYYLNSGIFYYLNQYITYLSFALLLLAGCITNSSVRLLTLLIVIPITMVWLFYFSYDIRNIALAVPFLSIALGFGLHVFFRFCTPIFLNYRNVLGFALLFASLSSSLFLLNKKYNSQFLTHQQISLQKKLGNAQANNLIYSYFATHSYDGAILTNNIFLEHLPELKNYYVYEGFTSIKKLLHHIQIAQGGYLFILEQDVSNKGISTMSVQQYLAEQEGQKFQKIFHEDKYLFYKIIRNV